MTHLAQQNRRTSTTEGRRAYTRGGWVISWPHLKSCYGLLHHTIGQLWSCVSPTETTFPENYFRIAARLLKHKHRAEATCRPQSFPPSERPEPYRHSSEKSTGISPVRDPPKHCVSMAARFLETACVANPCGLREMNLNTGSIFNIRLACYIYGPCMQISQSKTCLTATMIFRMLMNNHRQTQPKVCASFLQISLYVILVLHTIVVLPVLKFPTLLVQFQ